MSRDRWSPPPPLAGGLGERQIDAVTSDGDSKAVWYEQLAGRATEALN